MTYGPAPQRVSGVSAAAGSVTGWPARPGRSLAGLNEYPADKREISDRRIELIRDYAEKYGTLMEHDAIEMLKEMQGIAEDDLELQQKFVCKFEKVLPALKVFRFYPLENKLDAVVVYETARVIPLVE